MPAIASETKSQLSHLYCKLGHCDDARVTKTLIDGAGSSIDKPDVHEVMHESDDGPAGSVLFYLDFDKNFHALSTTRWGIF